MFLRSLLSSRTGNPVPLVNVYFSWLFYIGASWLLAALSVRCVAEPISEYPVTLEWDANSETDLAGYKLYFGTVSGTYAELLDAGNFTRATVAVIPGATYFFAVTAYNAGGLESPFSNEVTFTAPQLPELQVVYITPPVGTGSDNGVPDVTSLALLPNGSVSFIISADPGKAIRVEASSDLISWTFRGILENPEGGILVTDSDAACYKRRFYRVVGVVAE